MNQTYSKSAIWPKFMSSKLIAWSQSKDDGPSKKFSITTCSLIRDVLLLTDLNGMWQGCNPS